MAEHDKKASDQQRERSLTALRVGLFVMSLAAAGSIATPYASASSCTADCDCHGGNTNCCTMANGATCYRG
jgi:hypothetical protein